MGATKASTGPVFGIVAIVLAVVVAGVGVFSLMHAEQTIRMAVPWFREGAQPLTYGSTFSAQRVADADFVAENLDGHWLAVLGWFVPKGASRAARATAFDLHQSMRAEHHAVLVAGGADNGLPSVWLSVAPIAFDDATSAQDWCRDVLGHSCRAVIPNADPAITQPVVYQ